MKLFLLIKLHFPIGTKIPRPHKDTYVIKYGSYKRVEYLDYRIEEKSSGRLYEYDFNVAKTEIIRIAKLANKWFKSIGNTKPCVFTTMGGIFVVLGIAYYDGINPYSLVQSDKIEKY